jgi:enoyl-CoA hydratase
VPDNLSGVRIDRSSQDVTILTFDRPPVNALDAEAYRFATRALERSEPDGARAVVVTGAGRRAFCAGTDIRSMSLAGNDLEDAFAAAQKFFTAVARSSVPLVGALNGPAIGGGAMIASECDVLIAVADAHFRMPELQLGFPGGGSHLMRLVPRFVGLRMLLLGEELSAPDALSYGVIHRLVDPELLLPTALDCATRIARLDPRAVRAARDIVRAPGRDEVLEGYAGEMRAMRALLPLPSRPVKR